MVNCLTAPCTGPAAVRAAPSHGTAALPPSICRPWLAPGASTATRNHLQTRAKASKRMAAACSNQALHWRVKEAVTWSLAS